jgi:hypothetical protein
MNTQHTHKGKRESESQCNEDQGESGGDRIHLALGCLAK